MHFIVIVFLLLPICCKAQRITAGELKEIEAISQSLSQAQKSPNFGVAFAKRFPAHNIQRWKNLYAKVPSLTLPYLEFNFLFAFANYRYAESRNNLFRCYRERSKRNEHDDALFKISYETHDIFPYLTRLYTKNHDVEIVAFMLEVQTDTREHWNGLYTNLVDIWEANPRQVASVLRGRKRRVSHLANALHNVTSEMEGRDRKEYLTHIRNTLRTQRDTSKNQVRHDLTDVIAHFERSERKFVQFWRKEYGESP